MAWPILIGQLALIAYGVCDTMLTARYGASDLAALGLGVSIYVSVFLGLSGILQALTPYIGHLFGAQRFREIGHASRQGLWLAAFLSLIGCSVFLFPGPLLSLANASPVLIDKASSYLQAIAVALPASLAYCVYSSLNNAIGQPKMVMLLQVCGLFVKIFLNTCFIYGYLGFPELGGPGCGVATAIVAWFNITLGYFLLRRSTKHTAYALFLPKWSAPDWGTLRSILKLGLPIGFAFFIEVTSFAFMAIFIARLGELPLAAHQIAANIGAVMYMLPLSIASATSTLVAQSLGARELVQARHITRTGILLATLSSASLGLLIWLCREPILHLYTNDSTVIRTALPLFIFIACYQFFDALQSTIGFVLRAYHVVLLPMLFNACALWGVGLFGGCVLGLNLFGWHSPPAIAGVQGFWLSNSLALIALALTLSIYLRRVQRNYR